MQSSFKIAISGKGGVGKTTVCAVWAQLLAQAGLDVLAIDADSDPNLASALGVEADKCPEPLIKAKDLIRERTGAEPGSIGQFFKMNPYVSDLPEKYSYLVNGVKLLVLGAIENAGAGCACPESAFLKALLTHSMLHRDEVILVDLPAGVEFLGRACVQGVDGLVVVVEPGMRSIDTARHIATMGKNMGISRIGAFLNKITDEGQIGEIESQLGGIALLGSFGYNPAIQAADLRRTSVMEGSSELVEALGRAKEKMMEVFFGGAGEAV